MNLNSDLAVAPFTGAWIEISLCLTHYVNVKVAPFTGAWIEINLLALKSVSGVSRSLHGSVD